MTQKIPDYDGDGCNAQSLSASGLVLCLCPAEARILRKLGHQCITAAKMRHQVDTILCMGASGSMASIAEAFGRLDGVSSAVDVEGWALVWDDHKGEYPLIRAAVTALAVIPTPFQDPREANVTEYEEPMLAPCAGTTVVIIAENTFALVQAADTYAGYNCYRPRGRMDEPFTPQPDKVCLITKDEIGLLRLTEGATLVLTFVVDSQDVGEGQSRWPTAIRAVCGEWPDIKIGLAPMLAPPRRGDPFFLGLTRGRGYDGTSVSDPTCASARAFGIATNTRPPQNVRQIVEWAGRSDIYQLVRYGGLSLFIDAGNRRKVQLRSLGLIHSGELAGAKIYDMDANAAALTAWARDERFSRKRVSPKDQTRQRGRSSKPYPKTMRGTYRENTNPPHSFRVRLGANTPHVEASKLRNLKVCNIEDEGRWVTTVPLKSLSAGKSYKLNCRATVNAAGEVKTSQTRCKIRCPVWQTTDRAGLVTWLMHGSPNVIMAGCTPDAHIFAVVRVSNGTEDQQAAAVRDWCEKVGRRFPGIAGSSWCPESVRPDAVLMTAPNMRIFKDWKAQGLETACYDRYRVEIEHAVPLKFERRGVASASLRARAYGDKVEGLQDEGGRNTTLSGALLNIRDKFGKEALLEVAPALMAKSDLPEKEKRKMLSRISGGKK